MLCRDFGVPTLDHFKTEILIFSCCTLFLMERLEKLQTALLRLSKCVFPFWGVKIEATVLKMANWINVSC